MATSILVQIDSIPEGGAKDESSKSVDEQSRDSSFKFAAVKFVTPDFYDQQSQRMDGWPPILRTRP
ncbi:hypothetical protein BT69DRAFT_1281064, partial [Atractiella rhizophila]